MTLDQRRPMSVAELTQVAVVTGAAGLIGRAIALRLARDGMAIAVLDRNAAAAEATTAAVKAASGRAVTVVCDITDYAAVEAGLDKIVSEWGTAPSVLVNNAGITGRIPILEMPLEDFQRILKVNLTGLFIMTQVFARRMVADGIRGRIVNTASTSAEQVTRPGLAAYAASKAGVRMFTKSTASELARYGIRVNAVAPGVVETDITRAMLNGPGVRAAYVERIPLGKMGKPEDIANVVAFLVSEDSSHMTGSTLFVEGGALLGGTGVSRAVIEAAERKA